MWWTNVMCRWAEEKVGWLDNSTQSWVCDVTESLKCEPLADLHFHAPAIQKLYVYNGVMLCQSFWFCSHFRLPSTNELISNVSPAAGLWIAGQGHVLHGGASPLLLKTVWRRVSIEVLSFWGPGVRVWTHSYPIKVSSCWRLPGCL